MLAAAKGQLQITDLLLKFRASQLVRARFDRSAWMHAADHRQMELIQRLAGDGYPMADKLVYAASQGYTDVVRTLLRLKADP